MHHAIVVQELDTSKNLEHDSCQPPLVATYSGRDRFGHSRGQVAPEVRLLHDVDVVVVFKNVEDARNLRMLQRHEKFELLRDLLHCLFLVGFGIHLYHHLLLLRGLVRREENDALTAPAQLLRDIVLVGN